MLERNKSDFMVHALVYVFLILLGKNKFLILITLKVQTESKDIECRMNEINFLISLAWAKEVETLTLRPCQSNQ